MKTMTVFDILREISDKEINPGGDSLLRRVISENRVAMNGEPVNSVVIVEVGSIFSVAAGVFASRRKHWSWNGDEWVALDIHNAALPWSVKYNQRFPEWDEFSQPYIENADGNLVIDMPQWVGHPGARDKRAMNEANLIVTAVNCFVKDRIETDTLRVDTEASV